MKVRDLIKKLEAVGFRFLRNGGNHDIYKRDLDGKTIPVPRHREVNEITARGILKEAGIK